MRDTVTTLVRSLPGGTAEMPQGEVAEPARGNRAPDSWPSELSPPNPALTADGLERHSDCYPSVPVSRLKRFSFCYRLLCPIHSAFFRGMGGKPMELWTTPFPKAVGL
jgi:hypothetical protein